MRWLSPVVRRGLALFVDDGRFALVVVLWLAAVAMSQPLVRVPGLWRGAALFAGLALALVWSCLRRIASRTSVTRTASFDLSKVPEVTLVFWVIKIAATTLGETGGDTVTMTLDWGYLAGTALFLCVFVGLVIAQIRARGFHPWLYWATIVASTTFGTTMADFADRSLGIGYTGGSSLLLACLLAVLALWYRSQGTLSVDTVSTPKVEAFYWAAITFSQTLGTALGDWIADTGGLGYEGGAIVFAACLAVLAVLYFRTDVSRVLLFWAAFILTRPLGATVGDFLDKPVSQGGLALSRPLASAVIGAFIVVCLLVLPQRAGQHPSASNATASV